MDCQEAARRLNPYLDRELTSAEVVEVQRHLDACGGCADHFVVAGSIKRLVHRCLCDEAAPERLRQRLRKALDREC